MLVGVIFGLGGLILIYVLATYNNLQTLKLEIKKSLDQIGNILKRQASLITNLEDTVAGAAQHEKNLWSSFEKARRVVTEGVTKGITGNNVEGLMSGVAAFTGGMRSFGETNPEMKANANFIRMMDELVDAADKLLYARTQLIGLSQKYNTKLVVFPSNLVAKMFGFKEINIFQTPTEGTHVTVQEEELTDPRTKLSK